MSAVIRGALARRIGTAVLLVAAWCALWGSFSIANLASGATIVLLLAAVGLRPGERGGVRLLALAHFGGLVLVDLARSTASVAQSILSRPDRVDEAIVAVPCAGATSRHFLLMICAVTVTPGTAIVDADPDTGTLYLHVLHADEVPAVVAHVRRLSELAERALPTRSPAPSAEVTA